MNTSEKLLTDELRRTADEMPHRQLTFDDIRHGARRRRVPVALVAAAAAAAVIVAPVALLELTSRSSSTPPVAVSPTPERSATDGTPGRTAYPPVGQVVIDIADAPLGESPRIPVGVRDSVGDIPLSLAKGQTLVTFAPHGTGAIVVTADQEGVMTTRLVASDGSVEGAAWSTESWTLATSPDGSVAFVNRDGDLELDGPDGSLIRTWTIDSAQPLLPGGVLPDGSVAVLEEGQDRGVLMARPDGSVSPVEGLITVGGASVDGLLSGVVSLSDAGSCGVVLDPAAAKRLWRTCDYTLGHFSPDGRLVSGLPAYLDGIGSSSVSILDARTGQVLVDFEAQREPWSFVSDAVWEDDTHLLATVYSSSGGWHVMRLGVDGSVSIADLGKLGGNEMQRPVVLPASR